MLEIGLVAPWWDNETHTKGYPRFIRANVPVGWASPPEDPEEPEKEKEKPKDDPKPESPYFPSARATSPRPEPEFALRYVDGPYRPKPQASPPEEPKLNWLQRHQSELKKVLLAVTAVAAYVTAQLL